MPQDVDQRQLFEPEIVDPEGARALTPEAGIDVDRGLIQGVEDDLDLLPVGVGSTPPS